jgi:hypothetical protein
MYGDKAAKLRTPSVVPHTEVPEPPVAVIYIERCDNVDFRRPNKSVRRDPSAAKHLAEVGDTTAAKADKATAVDAKRELVVESIDRYRSALEKDPYDADATLKLAVAYDRALRKGCALVLLRRLNELSNHPQFATEGERNKDRVRDNREWFAGYRAEAIKAIP